jgi:MOSC domain-containing protein YiiM
VELSKVDLSNVELSVVEMSVVETRVGRPEVIGSVGDGDVTSAIGKVLVAAPSLALGEINLEGDTQADRSVHGGPDKSVYFYPSEHAAGWSADGFDLPPGSVGENACTRGATEADVRIGDVWRWGSALVQISQPRAPCYKLTLHSGRREIGPVMIETGRSGWYVRTIQAGEVPSAGPLELVERDERNATVAHAFAAMFTGRRPEADDPDLVRQVVQSPALAEEWLSYLVARNPLAG